MGKVGNTSIPLVIARYEAISVIIDMKQSHCDRDCFAEPRNDEHSTAKSNTQS